MGGMFYSLKEVMSKLKKTQDDVEALVKQGRLREFRDGPNLLFKIDEVESLLSDTTFMAAQKPPESEPQDEEVPLILDSDEQAEKPKGKSDADATAVANEGINVLGETETELSLTEDTLAETKATSGATSIIDGALSSTKADADEASLEEIEGNVNLDTFGSGSGLLDLSLQADDTSLGGILDEIYTPEGKEGKEQAKEGSELEVASEADQIMEQQPKRPAAVAEAELQAEAVPQAMAYAAEPSADKTSNVLGAMLFIPLLVTIYTIVVALIGQKNISSSVLGIKELIWPIVIGGWVLIGLFAGAAFIMGGKKGVKPAKKKKAEKEEAKQESPQVAPETVKAEAETTVQAPAEIGEAEIEAEPAEPPSTEDIKLDDLDLSDLTDDKI